MSEDRNAPRTHRRRFLAGVGVAATAGALAAGSRAAKAQGLDGEGFRPPRHDRTPGWGVWPAIRIIGFLSIQRAGWGCHRRLYANNILSAHRKITRVQMMSTR